jgi:hypothetical protein
MLASRTRAEHYRKPGWLLIPQGFSGEFEEALKWFGGIKGTVGFFETETAFHKVDDSTRNIIQILEAASRRLN